MPNLVLGGGGAAEAYTIDQSLRFDDGDLPYLERTPGSAGNRKTWTWSGWVKRGNLGTEQGIFSAQQDAAHPARPHRFQWNSNDTIEIIYDEGATYFYAETAAVSQSWVASNDSEVELKFCVAVHSAPVANLPTPLPI